MQYHPKDNDKFLYLQFSQFFYLMRRIQNGSIFPENCVLLVTFHCPAIGISSHLAVIVEGQNLQAFFFFLFDRIV